MKPPRPTHLLFAALALAALGLGVAALRYMPHAPGAKVAASGGLAGSDAPHPAGGAIVPGLRRALSPPAESVAEAPESAPPPPGAEVAEAPSPQTPAAPAPQTAAPTPEAPAPAAQIAALTPPAAPQEDAGVEGKVSFPPRPPTPPVRPVELRTADVPLPPARPRDLAALVTAPAPEPAAAPPAAAPSEPAATPPAAPSSGWSFSWPQAAPAAPAQQAATQPATDAPRYVDAPTPPSRPADLARLASARTAATGAEAASNQGAQGAAAPAEGTQVARLEEPTLKPAPEDAFQPPPPKFGMGDPVFVRIFKQEGQLELWLKKNGRYALYKTFPICKWSGRLGPKQKEADYQSPEGFYSVSARQLNPHSNYYRAFNVGYPNAFDRQNGRTGGLVMVHGACKSVGCFAMTDRGIEEIYGFVEAALRAGQKEIPVHIFPFRMTDSNIARETGAGGGWLAFVGGGGGYAQWAGFWRNLKQGYDLFEQNGEPPVAFACGDHYEFDGGSSACRRVAGW